MIRLYIKEKDMTTENRMFVKRETGEDLYLIVGKYGRMKDALSLYTLNGERLVEIKQKTLSVFPTFDLKINKKPFGKINKYPGVLGIYKPRFKVTKLNWVATGDFVKRNYTVRRNAKKIMEVNKNTTAFGEYYILTIHEDDAAPLCCLLSVIIDHYSPLRGRSSKEVLEEQGDFNLLN